MNIRSRLKRMESGIVASDSEFCACHPQRCEIFHQDLTADAETNEPQLSGEPVPDVCADCGKPTEKNRITIRICDRETLKKSEV